MASVSITSWQIDGEIMERGFFVFFCFFFFLEGGWSKITADGTAAMIKRCLLLGRKVMTNLDCILKSTDIAKKSPVYLVKAMVFPVIMYGCECWTIRKAEHRRTDVVELWCWRRKTLESPLDCKEIQTVNPKGNPVLNSHWKD